MCSGSPTITDVWDGRKNFLCSWKDHDHEHEWPSFIYIRGNQTCDGSPSITYVWDGRKNFFVSPWPWTWVTIYYIYTKCVMGHQLSWMCEMEEKIFLFLRDHEHEWPSIIYIRWDLMCDGSPTITYVWDERKNFLMFVEEPWTMSDHLLYI